MHKKLNRCFHDRKWKQALGIALETYRMDKIEYSISHSDDVSAMLNYSQTACLRLVQNRAFRQQVLRLIARLYRELKVPDYLRMCETLVFLNDSTQVANILVELAQSGVQVKKKK